MDRKIVNVGFSIKDPPKEQERRKRLQLKSPSAKKEETKEDKRKERNEWFPHKPSARKIRTGASLNFPLQQRSAGDYKAEWIVTSARDADRTATLIELDLEISQARRDDWAQEQRPFTSDPRNNHTEKSFRPPRTPNHTSGPVLHRPVTAAMRRVAAEESYCWNQTTKPDEEEAPRPQSSSNTKSRDSFQSRYRLAYPHSDRISLDKDIGSLLNDSSLDWGKAVGFEQPSILKKNKKSSSTQKIRSRESFGIEESNSKLSIADEFINRESSWISVGSGSSSRK